MACRPPSRCRNLTICPRLLIVGDEEAILLALAQDSRECGYRVVTTRDPEEAEVRLDHYPFRPRDPRPRPHAVWT